MSNSESARSQAEALREALRQREQVRSAHGATTRTQPTADGPPDLSDVFGGLFGALLGKSRRSGSRQARSTQRKSSARYAETRNDRYDAPASRAQNDAPASGGWRDRLQHKLDEAQSRLKAMQREAQRQERAARDEGPSALEALVAREAEHAEPRPAAARTTQAVEGRPKAAPPKRATAQRNGRRGRLRRRLRDAAEVRELYVASVLLGPPLARRGRGKP